MRCHEGPRALMMRPDRGVNIVRIRQSFPVSAAKGVQQDEGARSPGRKKGRQGEPSKFWITIWARERPLRSTADGSTTKAVKWYENLSTLQSSTAGSTAKQRCHIPPRDLTELQPNTLAHQIGERSMRTTQRAYRCKDWLKAGKRLVVNSGTSTQPPVSKWYSAKSRGRPRWTGEGFQHPMLA